MTDKEVPFDATCHSCRWFDLDDCRKRAPNLEGEWPMVAHTDWCGDWSQRWVSVGGQWVPFGQTAK